MVTTASGGAAMLFKLTFLTFVRPEYTPFQFMVSNKCCSHGEFLRKKIWAQILKSSFCIGDNGQNLNLIKMVDVKVAACWCQSSLMALALAKISSLSVTVINRGRRRHINASVSAMDKIWHYNRYWSRPQNLVGLHN